MLKSMGGSVTRRVENTHLRQTTQLHHPTLNLGGAGGGRRGNLESGPMGVIFALTGKRTLRNGISRTAKFVSESLLMTAERFFSNHEIC